MTTRDLREYCAVAAGGICGAVLFGILIVFGLAILGTDTVGAIIFYDADGGTARLSEVVLKFTAVGFLFGGIGAIYAIHVMRCVHDKDKSLTHNARGGVLIVAIIAVIVMFTIGNVGGGIVVGLVGKGLFGGIVGRILAIAVAALVLAGHLAAGQLTAGLLGIGLGIVGFAGFAVAFVVSRRIIGD